MNPDQVAFVQATAANAVQIVGVGTRELTAARLKL